ncbi:MAG: chemotaxis protein CheB [Gammaproteobacteria bacterium]|nr:chemotaxis protein CheB [Gammaproteobacteria bacterium]
MSDAMNHSATRVAILATSEKTQQRLASLLKDAGLNVVAHELPGDGFLAQLENASPDVLLVDLSDENGAETDVIDTLLDYDALPIFFNDSSPAGGGANALWAKKLARKLSNIATHHEPVIESVGKPETTETILDTLQTYKSIAAIDVIMDVETVSIEPAIEVSAASDVATIPVEKPKGAAVNIWVLGASLGGPQAVRQFLATVEEDLPVAFILAQHIGANHISLLAEQLNRVTPFVVLAGRTGHLIRHHEVILTPADKDIKITEDGYLSLMPAMENAIYSPSIDNVMSAVASHYGNMAGTIVFSGMGDDGARGCEAMAQHGGIVWAQDVDSCVISSMPDQARKTNTVTFSANPQALAERLYQYYRD